MLTIGWRVSELNKNWAFGHDASSIQAALPEFNYVEDYSAAKFVYSQNIAQINRVPKNLIPNTICRLSGMRDFDSNRNANLGIMGKCKAVIATNLQLFRIASTVSPYVYIIPNGIDTDKWRPVKQKVWNASNPVIGFAGNIADPVKYAYKGFDILRETVKSMNLALKVALYEYAQIPHSHMKTDFYDQIDILVLLTDGEGCSNTLKEVLACGVPVITTRTAGFHGEMMEHMHDVVFCEKNTEALKGAIETFINQPTLYGKMSKAGRAFACKYHNIREVAAQYKKVFERHFT